MGNILKKKIIESSKQKINFVVEQNNANEKKQLNLNLNQFPYSHIIYRENDSIFISKIEYFIENNNIGEKIFFCMNCKKICLGFEVYKFHFRNNHFTKLVMNF